MDSLKIKTDSVRTLCINGDESRWISFDLEDLNLPGRLKTLYQSLSKQQAVFEEKVREAEAIEGEDENGLPLSSFAMVDIQTEFAKYVVDGMDAVFGAGTCERLFGNVFNPEAYGEVLSGVMGIISEGRDKKISAALNKKPGKKRVMN